MIGGAAFSAWLLDSFLAFTLLLMLVLVLRRPVAQWLGPQAAYLLWLLPAARWFIPPLALPDMLRPFAMREHSAAVIPADVMVATPTTVAPAIAPAATALPAASTPSAIAPSSFDLASAALGLWGGVAILLFVLLLVHHHRVVRSVSRNAHELGRVGGVQLMESPSAAGPLAVGLLRRLVFVPATARVWPQDAQEMAVAHEVTHHRAGHLYHNHLAMLLLCLNWFNPVAWIAARAFIFDQEADCDAKTLGRYRFNPSDYARMLVAATTGALPSAGLLSPRANLINKSVILRRIGRISMREKSTVRRVLGGALVILSGAALLPLTASFAQTEAPEAPNSTTTSTSDRRITLTSRGATPTYRRDVVHNGETYKVYADHDVSEAEARNALKSADKAREGAEHAVRGARDALRQGDQARVQADAARVKADAARAEAEQAAWAAEEAAKRAADDARRTADSVRIDADAARRDALAGVAEARREGLAAAAEARRVGLVNAAEIRREAAAAAAEATREARAVNWQQTRASVAEARRAVNNVNWAEVDGNIARAQSGTTSATVVVQSNRTRTTTD